MHFLDTLLAYVNHHPGLAYGAVFLISLSESLAVIGLLLPGTVIMFGIGAVVSTGSLGLAPVLALAVAGAIAGDGVSYWLGRRYRERLADVWPFSRYPDMLKKGGAFFHRHGGKSVLFGRFVGPVRPVIPVVAGMLGMRPLPFGVINVLSAIGWALVYILPGLFFGTSLAVAGTVSTRLAVVAFILVAGIWGFVWLSRKLLSVLVGKGPVWFEALKQWSASESPDKRAMRHVKQIFSLIIFRPKGEEWLAGFLVLAFIAAGWGFFGVLQDVLANDPLVVADKAVYHFFQSLRTPFADNVFVAVTELGDTLVNVCLAFLVLGVLLIRKCHRTAGFWVLAVLGGWLGTQLLKWIIRLPRPVAMYQGASAYGFPSGHTTMSVILYGFLAVLLARGLAGTWRWGLFSVVMLIAFVIGISRLYLGAHWISDVLGGFFVGTSWTALLGIAYLKGPAERLPRRWLGLTVVLVVGLVGGWHAAQRHDHDLAFYAPRHQERTLSFTKWQADGWREFPAWRIDMAGEREQPLTIQWTGPPEDLARLLTTRGWTPPPALTLKSGLGMFAAQTPVEALPSLPRLHDGRTEALRLACNGGEGRLVLRLWPAGAAIAEDRHPLFIGMVEQERRRSLAGLITMASSHGGFDDALKALEASLDGAAAVRRVRRTAHEIAVENEHPHLHWHGEVLLAWEKGT